MESNDDEPARPPWLIWLLAVLAATAQVLAGMLPVVAAATALINALHGTAS